MKAIEVEAYTGDENFTSFSVDYRYEMTTAEKEMIERSELGILAFSWMGKHLGEKMDSGFKQLGDKIDRVAEKVEENIKNQKSRRKSGQRSQKSRWRAQGPGRES